MSTATRNREHQRAEDRPESLVGRRAERHRIDRLLAGEEESVLVVTAEPGGGRSALLRYGAAVGERAGRRVIAASGHDRLRAVLSVLDGGAGLDELPAAPLRMAALNLIDRAARNTPILAVMDDVTGADAEAIAVLLFAARRLPPRAFVLLVAAADRVPLPPGLYGAPRCLVQPLNDVEAGLLLDRQPLPPAGRLREEIVRRAGGNPLALIELTRGAGIPSTGRAWLQITGRAATTFAGAVEDLPVATRRVLLYAAAGTEEGLEIVLAAAGADLADCRPAEQARLLAINGDEVKFPSPMVPTVVYLGAHEADRRSAHARIAAQLPAGSGRRTWHLAKAAAGAVDEELAVALERAAAGATAEQRYFVAAEMLQIAAETSPESGAAIVRYTAAAAEAARGGYLSWCEELFQRVVTLTDDHHAIAAAAAGIGANLVTDPPAQTFGLVERLLSVGLRDRFVVSTLASLSAGAVLVNGDAGELPALRRVVELAREPEVAGWESDPLLALAWAVADPAGWPGRYGSLAESPLMRPVDGPAELIRLIQVGCLAWLLDELPTAVGHLRRAVAVLLATDTLLWAPSVVFPFIEALLEAGLWDEAGTASDQTTKVLAGTHFERMTDAAAAQRITLLVRRGRLEEARERLGQFGDPSTYADRMSRCLGHRAAGQLAAAEGDHTTATGHFLAMFDPDGRPVHWLIAPRPLAELAYSAVECGQAEAARSRIRAWARTADTAAARNRRALEHAYALLGPETEAVDRLGALVADPSGRDRPYEYAVAQVHYARALRGRRRYVEARPVLAEAVEALTRIGEGPVSAAAQELLRATGVRPAGGDAAAFTQLSAQQRQITQLAAQGLSNQEIGNRMGLSPRTIMSHLYHIFPKLGVVRRGQLRDMVPAR
ncbi:helix-turn-helix transcriptional regulator [Paractinoplanes atraurantiacus]|uniref:Regulatory protein, luxR family n=1 Tax=Paractinoplanes atraurantiacus TaxID=1036182 RepID=A0A285J3F0_9ACTN|nr:LuxR family transcriptional regulator [Actinoplanes atraurantiacus]SNY53651.1 regulatory protein, luxR family [Actinoplanes atraurantiacus]